MTTNASTVENTSPAAPRPHRGRRIALWILEAALAVQLAAWIAVALTTHDIGSAFTKPHPGAGAEVVIGGGIWLVQFAAAVFLAHRNFRRWNAS